VPKHLDKVRIELGPCSDGEYTVGRSVTCVLIDHPRDLDGIECVGDREDTSFDWNEDSSYPVRVSRPVPAFVVVCDDDRGSSQKLVRLKPFGTHSRVGLAGNIGLNVETSYMRNKSGGRANNPMS